VPAANGGEPSSRKSVAVADPGFAVRVYVSIDMEGVAGIATRNQCIRGMDDYPRGRVLMTAEANATIAGAFDGGATAVLVNDSHGDMANLLPDELDPRAELLLGSPKTASMVEGVDGGFDVAMFVGYHAGAGVEGGVLAHTYSSAVFYDVRLNGRSMTETELNARLAAAHGVPLGLVTGDDHLCRLVASEMPNVRTVEVKRGRGFTVAASLHPTVACERIREASAEVVANSGGLAVMDVGDRFEIEVDLVTVPMADLAAMVPGTRRRGRTVTFVGATIFDAFGALRCWMYLGMVAGR